MLEYDSNIENTSQNNTVYKAPMSKKEPVKNIYTKSYIEQEKHELTKELEKKVCIIELKIKNATLEKLEELLKEIKTAIKAAIEDIMKAKIGEFVIIINKYRETLLAKEKEVQGIIKERIIEELNNEEKIIK